MTSQNQGLSQFFCLFVCLFVQGPIGTWVPTNVFYVGLYKLKSPTPISYNTNLTSLFLSLPFLQNSNFKIYNFLILNRNEIVLFSKHLQQREESILPFCFFFSFCQAHFKILTLFIYHSSFIFTFQPNKYFQHMFPNFNFNSNSNLVT